MDKCLIKLMNTFSISGNEDEIKDIIKNELRDIKCDIKEDKIGNMIVKLGHGEEKLMICSHMDSIGFMVSYIEENGLIRAEKIGNFDCNNVSHSFVRFKNETIGKLLLNKDEIFIDIGTKNKETTLNKVKEGDTACLVGPYLEFPSNDLVSPSLDNKIGCYILLRLIKELKNTNREVYFVFSCEQKLGGRGIRSAAYSIDPDFCIIIDLVSAKDAIDCLNKIELDKGPVLKLMGNSIIMHKYIKSMLEEAANKVNINVQYSVSPGSSQCDLIHNERLDIRIGEIAVPCKYKNSVSEMVSINDIENTISIIKEAISN
ncbi:hydrolase [Clostridium carboxidivorans P7]|uniref:Peptidase M42 family protein n=1 Tax=Clostridium carboxidivorans P7 TaxID=536227 RepID=C6Q2T9_9CLOT|nr:M42 family peptidase [Clostridium carboxidivorans]AKN33179.1 hydrolase [Clostridium carboxidivorans P7]EET84189.1 peptidase M42 family protein [Clostridium carboxidivorans P7]EFG86062.1 M42 glutamyl aminopeptidase [Clostridium carboxidivorans P7]